MVARIITAIGTALIAVLSLTITSKIVDYQHRAKTLGLIFIGVSSSLVIGVPIGIFISELLGWRTVFLGIAYLIIIIFWGALSWALTPPMQKLPIQTTPKTSDIQQSINTSALQIGISIGSSAGEIDFTMSGLVMHLATFGSLVH